MGVLSDMQLRQLAHREELIRPFIPVQERSHGLSHGCSSFGYDIRLSNEFMMPNLYQMNGEGVVLDPAKGEEQNRLWTKQYHESVVIPPGGFVLGRSEERIVMPRDCIALCLGKSSYARCGLIVNVTPLEPEWEGWITMELSNTAPVPVRVWASAGIAQLIFLRGDAKCLVSYKDRKGKYQNQEGVVPSRASGAEDAEASRPADSM